MFLQVHRHYPKPPSWLTLHLPIWEHVEHGLGLQHESGDGCIRWTYTGSRVADKHILYVFSGGAQLEWISKKFRPKQSIGHALMPWLSSQFLFFLHLFYFGLNCGHGPWVCMGVFFTKVSGASVSLLWQWQSLHKHCWCAYDNTWSHQLLVAVAPVAYSVPMVLPGPRCASEKRGFIPFCRYIVACSFCNSFVKRFILNFSFVVNTCWAEDNYLACFSKH